MCAPCTAGLQQAALLSKKKKKKTWTATSTSYIQSTEKKAFLANFKLKKKSLQFTWKLFISLTRPYGGLVVKDAGLSPEGFRFTFLEVPLWIILPLTFHEKVPDLVLVDVTFEAVVVVFFFSCISTCDIFMTVTVLQLCCINVGNTKSPNQTALEQELLCPCQLKILTFLYGFQCGRKNALQTTVSKQKKKKTL